MIYTVGHTKSYLEALNKATKTKPVRKIGRNEKYEGGCAFKTIKDAEKYLKKINKESVWSVFGIEADWDIDTSPSDNSMYNSLLKNSEIVLLKNIDYHKNI